MLKINRVKVLITTLDKDLIFDESFTTGINIIRSGLNSSGKSSVLSSIYYGLGLEEIIGGRGHKVLSSAFKTSINTGENEVAVLESKIYLEISNGDEVITLFRAAKSKTRKDSLITVYFSSMKDIGLENSKHEDMYVHFPNSATNKRGFFTFLEQFLKMNLPMVPSTDNEKDRKLYLQLVFSGMFIEQKRGWSDIFSGMPHLGISESKKRVMEYLLDMSTLKNEKLKYEIRQKEKEISLNWKIYYEQFQRSVNSLSVQIQGITGSKPEIINNQENFKIYYKDEHGELTELSKYLEILKVENSKKPDYIINNNTKNISELQSELKKIDSELIELQMNYNTANLHLESEKSSTLKLINGLKLIEEDIKNNKDASRLVALGSEEDFNSFNRNCPTCGQGISDTLLISQNENPIMTIEENIVHLKSQKELFKLTIVQKENQIKKLEEKLGRLSSGIMTLQSLATSFRDDIYKLNGEISDSEIERKIFLKVQLKDYATCLENFYLLKDNLIRLSADWKSNLEKIETLPKNKFTEEDEKKLDFLANFFRNNLNKFGYRSVNNLNHVSISKETYLPVINKFDMKFDSSASDHIRSIWSFTLAILQTSEKCSGKHQNILILDEPGQHSIIDKDLGSLFNVLNSLQSNNQFIVGLTLPEETLENLLKENKVEKYNVVNIENRAFN